jgi:hypothetical protein
MEPIAPEHTSWTPVVKPSMVVWLPAGVAAADLVGLPDEDTLAEVAGLAAATQPKRAIPAASVAASIGPVLSKDRDGDRAWILGRISTAATGGAIDQSWDVGLG